MCLNQKTANHYHSSDYSMYHIRIPIRVNAKGLERETNLKKSIDSAISLILTTHQYSTPADPMYGFVFTNLKFEIFNENEGVVYNSGDTTDAQSTEGLYDKKVSGSSKNLNTFAADLKDVLNTYEKRLGNISVIMTYIREERMIYVTIKGTILETQEPYSYMTTINVWK